MFSTNTYTERRAQLTKSVESGLALFIGNNEVGMNYSANPYHFRQDSNFLYFFGIDLPGLAAIIDFDEGQSIIFGDELTVEHIVWTGPQPSIKDLAMRSGVNNTMPFAELVGFVKKAVKSKRKIHFTPPYRYDNMLFMSEMLNIPAGQLKEKASVDLIKGIVALRSHKTKEEVSQIEMAINVSGAMHLAAIKATKPGIKEQQLAGIIQGIAKALGCEMAYGTILTINGHVLHNHYHGNTLQSGQMVLGDYGAETGMHYAGDITRTCPVDAQFTPMQKEIYDIVLDAEVSAIAALKPGITYKEVHLATAKKMAEGLKGLGLMKGDMDEAVALGAHALFFPHGLGHMLGLDVHDMEDLGEQYVGYNDDIQRSKIFGTAYLRLARNLEPGFVLTVEPGIYFIPELIDLWKGEGKFKEFINYDKVESYRHFSGIRTEDNVLITSDGHRVLGNPIPKTAALVEGLKK